ncbi:MAG: hypothetical protein AB7K09_15710 [Planctomycetota bacterium]
MKSIACPFAVVTWLACAAFLSDTPARGQDPAPKHTGALILENMPVADALLTVAERTDTSVVIGRGIDASTLVSIGLTDTDGPTAVGAIVAAAGLAVDAIECGDVTVLVVRKTDEPAMPACPAECAGDELRVQLHVHDYPTAELLRSLAERYDLSVVLHVRVAGDASLHLNKVPAMAALWLSAVSQGYQIDRLESEPYTYWFVRPPDVPRPSLPKVVRDPLPPAQLAMAKRYAFDCVFTGTAVADAPGLTLQFTGLPVGLAVHAICASRGIAVRVVREDGSPDRLEFGAGKK